MVIFYWILLVIWKIFANETGATTTQKLTKLLVVSHDGFRYDYFERNMTPYLKALKNEGIYSDYMISDFPTNSIQNHHTIATGLHIENHGVVNSAYYDPKRNKTVKSSYELHHYDNNTLPIWILNEKAGGGRRSGVQWAGNEYEYGGMLPTFKTSFNKSIPYTKRIDDVISWFNHRDTPINFAMLYIEDPDHHAHAIGFNNDRFNEVLRQVDVTVRYIHDSLKNNGLEDVNVIHLSDHGMATNKLATVIDLNKYIDKADYDTASYRVTMIIHPRAGKEKLLYEQLQRAARETNGFDVYWKKDIPQRYHFRNNSRIGPILIVSKIGYTFEDIPDRVSDFEREYEIKIDENSEFGSHGYDNEESEMRAFFIGVGPAFYPGCKIPPFQNVDLVPLFCHILNIPQPSVDGTLDVFRECLRKKYSSPFNLLLGLLGVCCLSRALVYCVTLLRRSLLRALPSRADTISPLGSFNKDFVINIKI